MTDVSICKKISRVDFLKLAGVGGTGFMLLPLVPLVKALGTTVPINIKPVITKRTNMVGPDGVAFLYLSKPKGAVDKYGITKLYPTKLGGLEWFNKWDNGRSRYLNEGDHDPYDSRFMYTCGQPNAPLRIVGNGDAHVTKYTSSARLFVCGPWLNTEMTVFVKGQTGLSDVQLRSRSNHETSGCFGNYLVKWLCEEEHVTKNKVSIEVEPMHPYYSRHHDEHDFDGFPLDKWVGFKQVTRTVNNTVKVEGYFSTGSKTQWCKQTEFVFNGTNINDIIIQRDDPLTLQCTGQGDNIAPNYNENTLWLNSSQWCWIRLNGADFTLIKWFSIREIEP